MEILSQAEKKENVLKNGVDVVIFVVGWLVSAPVPALEQLPVELDERLRPALAKRNVR